MKKKKLFHIGTFGKPVGLKGEIKIIMHNFEFNKFKSISSYLVDEADEFLNFQYLKINKNKLTGKLKKCNSINCAERLKGKKIFIDKNNLPKTNKNQFYVFDLINIKKNNNENFYIPMNDDNIVKINIEKKLVIVNPIKGILD